MEILCNFDRVMKYPYKEYILNPVSIRLRKRALPCETPPTKKEKKKKSAVILLIASLSSTSQVFARHK